MFSTQIKKKKRRINLAIFSDSHSFIIYNLFGFKIKVSVEVFEFFKASWENVVQKYPRCSMRASGDTITYSGFSHRIRAPVGGPFAHQHNTTQHNTAHRVVFHLQKWFARPRRWVAPLPYLVIDTLHPWTDSITNSLHYKKKKTLVSENRTTCLENNTCWRSLGLIVSIWVFCFCFLAIVVNAS